MDIQYLIIFNCLLSFLKRFFIYVNVLTLFHKLLESVIPRILAPMIYNIFEARIFAQQAHYVKII